MLDEQGRYVIEDYPSKPPFFSFLPGVAGPLGVPVWCCYANRGQAVCSFGARDRDHAVMEFAPARIACQTVGRTGFRTFVRTGETCRELFTKAATMHVGMNEVEITCRDGSLEASAVYFCVPGERTPALARVLTLRNTGRRSVSLELLDGMPAVVPGGMDHDALKYASSLSEAWIQVEGAERGQACFRTALADEGADWNFGLGWDAFGNRLSPLVQPELIFGQDTALTAPQDWPSLEERGAQLTENRFPCCFMPLETALAPGKAVQVCSLWGQAEDKKRVSALADRVNGAAWFETKRREARELADELTAPAAVHTVDPVFDACCRRSYLDNLLRGGAPALFRDGWRETPFYLYARGCGGPEADFGCFSLGREYYAQGGGGFREVSESRRCSVRFAPEVGEEDIHTFYDLIQPNGYNPLVLGPTVYRLPAVELRDALDRLPDGRYEDGLRLLSKPFTPGSLMMALEDWGLEDAEELTASLVCAAVSEPDADFREGYWSDHWIYGLDLIESYLSVYPERKEQLLFGEERYRWYAPRAVVKPRAKRYRMTPNGLRQVDALDEEIMANSRNKWVHTADGREAHSILMGKLLLLCAIKFATLDAAGMGVELEGGRPGRYGGLDGLPGLLGSSMAETCELARLLRFTIEAVEGHEGDIAIFQELGRLFLEIYDILNREEDHFARWDKMNQAKETFRFWIGSNPKGVRFTGTRVTLHVNQLVEMLREMERATLDGIRRAVELGGGICPTYFVYEATGVVQTLDGPMPTGLAPRPLPLFLEGPVHWLRLAWPEEEKRTLAGWLKESGLYDHRLRMYKLSESLSGVSREAGRALGCAPGWLENESIWLDMEYKYLLELLRNGLYDQFSEAFHDAAIPFQDPERYGRSPLESVSFLTSSASPDPAAWGRGHGPRLSGAAAAFLEIWQLMFFGPEPFHWEYDELFLSFSPFIPDYLMPPDGDIEAVFLGKTKVFFHAPGLARLVPGETVPVRWELTDRQGDVRFEEGPYLTYGDAMAVRAGQIEEIHVTMGRME